MLIKEQHLDSDYEKNFKRSRYANREEWLQNRTKGIGGSDCSCIIGQNPYKSNVKLYKEKVGLITPDDISNNEAVKFGNNGENAVRELFNALYDEYIEVYHREFEIISDNEYPFIRCSLDGEINVIEDFEFYSEFDDGPMLLKKGMRGVLEIKTTSILSSMQRESWKNQIPSNYYCQLLHNAYVSGYDFVIMPYLMKYDYGGKKTMTIKFCGFMVTDVEEDLKYLISSEINFWNKNYLKKVAPNELLPKI